MNTLKISWNPTRNESTEVVRYEIHYIRQLITTRRRTWFAHGLIFEDIQGVNNANPRVDTFALATWNYSTLDSFARTEVKFEDRRKMFVVCTLYRRKNLSLMYIRCPETGEKQRYRVHLRAIRLRRMPSRVYSSVGLNKRHTTPHLNLREGEREVRARFATVSGSLLARPKCMCLFLTFDFSPSLDR